MTNKKGTIASKTRQTIDNSSVGELRFPNVGIVFLQSFSIPASRVFSCAEERFDLLSGFWKEKSLGQSVVSQCYELPGFNIEIVSRDGTPRKTQNKYIGKCRVLMNVFFEHVVSISYNFCFNQSICCNSLPFTTQDLIDFISLYMEDYSVRLFTHNVYFSDISVSKEGCHIHDSNLILEDTELSRTSNYEIIDVFEEIRRRYKLFVLNNYTLIGKGLEKKRKSIDDTLPLLTEFKYAVVNFFPDTQCVLPDGTDLFNVRREHALTNQEVVNHVLLHHRLDYVSLMTLISIETWSENSFESICGPDISTGTELAFHVGEKVALILQSTSREDIDDEIDPAPWKNTSEVFGAVTCPTWLIQIQFVLAQKVVIQDARNTLVNTIVSTSSRDAISDVINRNQNTNFTLAKAMLQFDAVHCTLALNETTQSNIKKRLGVEDERKRFESDMGFIDNSLRNIKDGISASREVTMNIILGIVSMISAFQLFFVGTQMPFLSDFWKIDSTVIGALLITLIAGLAIFFTLIGFFTLIRHLFSKHSTNPNRV